MDHIEISVLQQFQTSFSTGGHGAIRHRCRSGDSKASAWAEMRSNSPAESMGGGLNAIQVSGSCKGRKRRCFEMMGFQVKGERKGAGSAPRGSRGPS